MKEEDNKSRKDGFNKFLKYSSLAFEMGIIIFAGALLGMKLDKKVENETPWFAIGLSLFAIFASLYLTIKRLKDDQ